ncbi:hypothetical protein A2926_00980 [Candidatus Giovannonibacteria bacterium RIFCSPLOWO2_01_FULL_44_40]|uniref:Uncharacterized protein n=1 Tax=Candidatus Giovannonibacteria bacterium RIFCSPHIGHO2_01_FULL_45_23 TaxID=1798325 RepID=A0A1F5VGM9_9BACT|nr:MAG: hypothetical protein A2834_02710 [Candidatus Giovannonibacteria bacterium RIFCSPHIGHO2_01_FULL_45_23]OGF75157.1 MAG: hypothetical protein A3C77_03685 [Candidatus Giovannonibacteria bacterium RIFCSPHIGHO2_02_FULL_45_13]OGF80010.1 MAG: hypothetical protein A2926_00980 [Candidatus Giovannonibacteria bacterium RIFCSPLOWO2_01_FULL_44_40]
MTRNRHHNLIRDLAVVALSVVVAILLYQTGAIKNLLESAERAKFFGSFIAGMFFVSVFTAAPAVVALVELMKINPVVLVAFFGGLGALSGDFLIFRFVKDHLADDLLELFQKPERRKIFSIFQWPALRWIIPIVGALIIASPLPDELGLVMLGLSKTDTKIFIPLSFTLNFLGILAIGLIAKV